MTDAEWAVCGAPSRMLEHLGDGPIDRPRRLLGCGLGRHIWPALADARSRDAVEIAERFADGAADEAERAAAEAGARAAMRKARRYNRNQGRYECFGTGVPAWAAGRVVGHWGVHDAGGEPPVGPARDTAVWEDAAEALYRGGADWHAELRWLCQAIRCVFGSPFRATVPHLRVRRAGVLKLAQAIYDDRAFDRLPALADALEAAGVEDAAALAHCREPGAHVRGCWVLDAVLGKR